MLACRYVCECAHESVYCVYNSLETALRRAGKELESGAGVRLGDAPEKLEAQLVKVELFF